MIPKPAFNSLFNDFSRYKNNELKNYFFKKQIDYYNKTKEKSKIKTNAFMVSGFSFVLGFAKEIYDEKIDLNKIDNLWEFQYNFNWPNILFIVLISFLIGVLYIIVFIHIPNIMQFILKKIRQARMVNNAELSDLRKITDYEFLDMFRNEVLNQLSLTLSMMSHIEKENYNKIENQFYLYQAIEYLKSALTTQQSMLVYPKVMKKIKSNDFPVKEDDIMNAIMVSEDILQRMKNQESYPNLNVSEQTTLLRGIVVRIKDILQVQV